MVQCQRSGSLPVGIVIASSSDSWITSVIFVCARALACEVNEDTTHNLRGHAEEVRAILPADGFPVDQADVGFVDEGRGLQQMVGRSRLM